MNLKCLLGALLSIQYDVEVPKVIHKSSEKKKQIMIVKMPYFRESLVDRVKNDQSEILPREKREKN